MKLFKSREPNLVHYVTAVTYDRFPVFSREECCSLFMEALVETRTKDPFKLIGYVIMPDHFHLLANPLDMNITKLAGKLKGRAASKILKWLRSENEISVLQKLALRKPLASGQTHAVWLQDFSAIDIWSHKFIRQKLNYIHLNPLRAGLCDHPANWRWSSYRAYFRHDKGSVPIEVDLRWLWTETELAERTDKSVI